MALAGGGKDEWSVREAGGAGHEISRQVDKFSKKQCEVIHTCSPLFTKQPKIFWFLIDPAGRVVRS
jgi:hypothetical protein